MKAEVAMESETCKSVLELFRRTADTVPAYRLFLADKGIDPDAIGGMAAFRQLPLTTKANYHQQYSLPERCRGGELPSCDMIAVSSGSTGTPTFWPRTSADESASTRRFEQVLVDAFGARLRRTLAVVCFPLGTWVGGLYTLSCLRRLADSLPLTVVAPGNNKAEILRVIPELGRHFDQVVLLGYPPFLKDVIDTGLREGIDWARYAVKLVAAGEVFSEQWRTLLAGRAGLDPGRDVASLYGTADGGVLANETPLTVRIRRLLAADPAAARDLFGEPRLPTLLQYDPADRYFETVDGTLLFTSDGGVPLIRYHIADHGGLIPHARMLEFCRERGYPVPADSRPHLPFVYVFGRTFHNVSIFGANVYPENVAIGLEQHPISAWVTGKFVLTVIEGSDLDHRLEITVELAPGHSATEARAQAIAESIRAQLLRLNSEYANYVPEDRQLPHIDLRPAGDPAYFPIGVKHRYTR